jgi:hypothetical protein
LIDNYLYFLIANTAPTPRARARARARKPQKKFSDSIITAFFA